MSKHSKSLRPDDHDLSPFGRTLELALKHYNDASWLGENSLLATPYLLHQYVEPHVSHAHAWGQALRKLLRRAVGQISDPVYAERYKEIIRGRYFLELSEEELFDRVGLQRAAFHASRKSAINCLEQIIVNLLNPALRLEAPMRIERTLFGRKQQMEECAKALHAGRPSS
jgi:hypothetical protein